MLLFQSPPVFALVKPFQSVVTFSNLCAKLLIRPAELRGGRQFEQPRDERPQHYGGAQRCCGRRDLEEPLYPVIRVPQRPNFEKMGRSAGEDERCEHPKNPTKGNIRTLPHEVGKCKRDRVIGYTDNGVGNHLEPNQRRLPKQAKTMRGKACLTKYL